MASCKLLGVQQVDFTSDDGKPIVGIKLHISYLSDNVHGEKVDTRFLSESLCKKIGITAVELIDLIGSDVELVLNPDGKVVGIAVT